MKNKPLLSIKNLTVTLGNKELLHGVDLDVAAGARHLLRGSNGSGKTTLVQTIAGNPEYHLVINEGACHPRRGGLSDEVRLGGASSDKNENKINSKKPPLVAACGDTPPLRGGDATSQIIFDGRDITKLSATERAIAGIFLGAQNVPEISGLSVMSFLKHSLSAHAAAAGKELSAGDFFKQLITARERLNIPESWLSRSINVGFSGGERKRLMMLRLILIRPKLAILDEPDSGVDAETQKLFAEIIHEMNCPPTETLRISTPPKGGVISESERLPPWGESQSASKAKRDAPGPNKIEDFVGWAVGGQTTFLIISHQEKFTEIVAPTAITTLEHGKVVV